VLSKYHQCFEWWSNIPHKSLQWEMSRSKFQVTAKSLELKLNLLLRVRFAPQSSVKNMVILEDKACYYKPGKLGLFFEWQYWLLHTFKIPKPKTGTCSNLTKMIYFSPQNVEK
jgi:hypothetical protein